MSNNGLAAAILITAPSLRAAVEALQGVGRTRAKRLRDEAEARGAEVVLSRLFTEENEQMGQVTGRLSRGATSPEKIALSLARAAWRLETLGEGGREILFEERHLLPNAYDWRAEGACGSGALQWVKGGGVKGSIDYSRRRCITTTRGAGWTERLQIEGDKALAEKIGKGARSWGGWITL